MCLICKKYSCVLSSGFYMQSMTIFSTLQFQQARTDTQVGQVRLMQVIRKRTRLSNIACLAKGFACVWGEGGRTLEMSEWKEGVLFSRIFFTLCENIEEESASSWCP